MEIALHCAAAHPRRDAIDHARLKPDQPLALLVAPASGPCAVGARITVRSFSDWWRQTYPEGGGRGQSCGSGQTGLTFNVSALRTTSSSNCVSAGPMISASIVFAWPISGSGSGHSREGRKPSWAIVKAAEGDRQDDSAERHFSPQMRLNVGRLTSVKRC